MLLVSFLLCLNYVPSAFVSVISCVPSGPVTHMVASGRPRSSLKTDTHGFSRLPGGPGGRRRGPCLLGRLSKEAAAA